MAALIREAGSPAIITLSCRDRNRVVLEQEVAGLDQVDAAWREKADAVDEWIARRHVGDPTWQRARESEAAMGRLLASGQVAGRLLVVRAA